MNHPQISESGWCVNCQNTASIPISQAAELIITLQVKENYAGEESDQGFSPTSIYDTEDCIFCCCLHLGWIVNQHT